MRESPLTKFRDLMYQKLLPPVLSLAVLSGLLFISTPATVASAEVVTQSHLNVQTVAFHQAPITADAKVKLTFSSPVVSSIPKPQPKPKPVVEATKPQTATEDITTSGDTSIEGMQKSAQTIYLATAGITPIVDDPSPASPKLEQVVNAAKKGLGTSYVWGGTSPVTGWDCSGYVQWVYAQAGISLPRTFQWVGAEKINQKDAVPGDIVVQNDGMHIGIYSGNGIMWSALNPSVGTLEHSTSIMKADFYRIITK